MQFTYPQFFCLVDFLHGPHPELGHPFWYFLSILSVFENKNRLLSYQISIRKTVYIMIRKELASLASPASMPCLFSKTWNFVRQQKIQEIFHFYYHFDKTYLYRSWKYPPVSRLTDSSVMRESWKRNFNLVPLFPLLVGNYVLENFEKTTIMFLKNPSHDIK